MGIKPRLSLAFHFNKTTLKRDGICQFFKGFNDMLAEYSSILNVPIPHLTDTTEGELSQARMQIGRESGRDAGSHRQSSYQF